MTAAPDPEDRLALLALIHAHGPALPRRRLLETHGSARDALAAGPAAWRQAGCTPEQRAALARPPRMQATLDWLARPHCHVLGLHDPAYPPLLRAAPNPPLALFVEGEPNLLHHPSVAVVGSRRPSAAGREHAVCFADRFARAGFVVASGLAAGVDAAAHQAALALPAGRGLTLAVLGTGVDTPYPPRHAGLRDQVAAAGAVVSEYLPGTGPQALHFPARNRILAALSLGTVVIEAALRSGALITARLAAEAGREAFALPGSIHNPMARGCHRLIRDGATLVEDPDEVLAQLGPLAAALAGTLRRDGSAPIEDVRAAPHSIGPQPLPLPPPPPPTADPDYQRLWQALGHDPTPMDSLIQRTGLTAATLSSMLLAMELEGRVVALHGRYTRT